MKKKLWICISVVLFIGIGIRIWYINKQAERPQQEWYEVGEEVEIEENYFWDGENAKNYTVTVISAKLMSLEEYANLYELDNLDTAFADVEGIGIFPYPEKIVDVRLKVKNKNLIDMGDVTGFFVGECRLTDGDCILSQEDRLFWLVNPTIWLSAELRPNSEMEISIPYGFSPNAKMDPIPEKRIREGNFSLAISYYPIQKNLKVKIE